MAIKKAVIMVSFNDVLTGMLIIFVIYQKLSFSRKLMANNKMIIDIVAEQSKTMHTISEGVLIKRLENKLVELDTNIEKYLKHYTSDR